MKKSHFRLKTGEISTIKKIVLFSIIILILILGAMISTLTQDDLSNLRQNPSQALVTIVQRVFQSFSSNSQSTKIPDRSAQVKRKNLTVKLIESGEVQAIKYHTLYVNIRSVNPTLKYVVAEGSSVTKDQVVAIMTSDDIQRQIDEMSTQVNTALKRMEVDKKNLEVQYVVNETNIRSKKNALEKAKRDYLKYRDLEGPKAAKETTIKIDEAKLALDDAVKNLKELKEEQEKNLFVAEDEEEEQLKELESAQRQVESAQNSLDVAYLDEKLLRLHTHPDSLESFKNTYKQSLIDLQQAEVEAQSEVLTIKNQYSVDKKDYVSGQKRLQQLQKDQKSLTLKAPIDGLVIYGDPARHWTRRNVRLGRTLWHGQPLITIPDTESYNILIHIDEKARGKLIANLKTVTTFPAIPGLSIQGTVSQIGNIAKPRDSMIPDSPKAYEVKVLLDNTHPNLTQGMSAKTEILIKTLEQVLTVPIEAVFYDEGKPFCYLDSTPAQKIDIEIGATTENEVEITKGLQEGDSVLLFAPQPEISS